MVFRCMSGVSGRSSVWMTMCMQIISCLMIYGLMPAFSYASTGAYEAVLPENLKTAKNMCALVPCGEVFPGAAIFSERLGNPPYVEAYSEQGGQKKLIGYVMLSTDITDTPAYSGKPVVTLIGMDIQGKFVGIKVLKHSEPILLLGIPEAALLKFNQQYIGRSVADKIEVGPGRPAEGILGVDAISGATVTVIVQNQVMMAAGTAVAKQVGILAPTVRLQPDYKIKNKKYSWSELVSLGSIKKILVHTEQVGLPKSETPFIEMWFGDLNHPDVGISVLGEENYRNLHAHLKESEHAIFIIRSNGNESFKGSGFVRGGMYDRIRVKQGADSFTFRDLDYVNLYGVQAQGAPAYNESAIFIIRSQAFSPAYPWTLAFLGNRIDRATGAKSFANFEQTLWLADELFNGGRPQADADDAAWIGIWKSRALPVALFVLLLTSVTVVYAFREKLTRRATLKNKWPVNLFKYSAWVLSIGFVGFGAMAQPSITQVLTWFHSILFQWTWSLFLSDPFIFVFWIFIILTVFLYGRGLFCGWLCPFGSLSEALYKVAGKIGLKRFQSHVPHVVHDKLKWLKYAIFLGLLSVSLFSMGLAEVLAEVEPFKTTFLVGITHRAWPYGLFVCVLLAVSLFIERPYCKYICPLGAALAIPSTFRWFGLKRKQDCNSCKACAVGCGSLAIDKNGRIDHRECLHCLDCMVLYTEPHACPPLAKERKQREKAGLRMTPIGKDGYFIPIQEIRNVPKAGPDPRMASEPVYPAHLTQSRRWGWLMQELKHHLWPWQRTAWQKNKIWQLTGFVVAAGVSLAWIFAAIGKLASGVIIALWFGWSMYELVLRMLNQRYVKEGPWWRAQYRYASLMDMFSYVCFKNLIIGAALFLILKFFSGLNV